MYTYPVVLEADDNDTVMVSFPDVPGAVSFGADEDEALTRAVDALETMFIASIGDRRHIPEPSRPHKRQRTVTLPPLAAAKVALYQTMREQGVRKAELARRLHCDFRQVDRLLDLRHRSRLDRIDAALAALGKCLEIGLRDAACPCAV